VVNAIAGNTIDLTNIIRIDYDIIQKKVD